MVFLVYRGWDGEHQEFGFGRDFLWIGSGQLMRDEREEDLRTNACSARERMLRRGRTGFFSANEEASVRTDGHLHDGARRISI